MAVDWQQYQKDAEAAANEAKAAIDAEVQKVRDFYASEFAKVQSAALEARDGDVGLGETPDQFAARIASVPGSFSDRAQSATEVVNAPKILASAPPPGAVTPVAVPQVVSATASVEQATVITEAPVSTGQESVEPTPEQPPVQPAEVVTEPQPSQPTPEPSQEPEQASQPDPTPVVEQPAPEVVEEPAQEPEATPVVEETVEPQPTA